MTGFAMTDHKLISTPVSFADGMKRGDRGTWMVLVVTGVIAVVAVLLINLFVEKPPPVRWPTVTAPASPGAPSPAVPEEPKTFDVAPAGAVPSKDRQPPGTK